ncbi:MAG: DUF3098 domain-containing protein [Bacteroidales bacterium]|nr:DUF3098 domain-containing protein [Bacteroidales bacterium]
MNTKFAITKKGLLLLASGVAIMCLGFVLMAGPAVKDPAVFNEAMFSFRRTVLAPILIIAGLGIDIFAIMFKPKKEE